MGNLLVLLFLKPLNEYLPDIRKHYCALHSIFVNFNRNVYTAGLDVCDLSETRISVFLGPIISAPILSFAERSST